MTAVADRPLTGRRIITTREHRGRLDSLLARAGADVVHVPLITVGDAPDGGAALARELERLPGYDWLVVTSQHGAKRVGAAAAGAVAVRLAAVGARSADELAALTGRSPDVVPSQQSAIGLVQAMPPPMLEGSRVLLVQADRADDTVAAGLRQRGYEVTVTVGYSTNLRVPSAPERHAVASADAVAFASGSAAQAWAQAFGSAGPAVVVAIGPSTHDAAVAAGLQITHTAADHSLDGVFAEILSALRHRP